MDLPICRTRAQLAATVMQQMGTHQGTDTFPDNDEWARRGIHYLRDAWKIGPCRYRRDRLVISLDSV